MNTNKTTSSKNPNERGKVVVYPNKKTLKYISAITRSYWQLVQSQKTTNKTSCILDYIINQHPKDLV